MPREAVFLDRDGTLIEEVHYLAEPEQVRLIANAAQAVRKLNEAGVLVVVVTNQAGVARGYFPESHVFEVHEHLSALLAQRGARLDGYYYCPHHPEGVNEYRCECDCRKPKPGLLQRAARELDIDLSQSWMIGDKVSDAEAGTAAGCRSILVRTGHELPNNITTTGLLAVVDDLVEAVEIVVLTLRVREDTSRGA
ncbi:MAG: D-glycero-beta-D-manno-heptose 1,7-bisphosphate 7-phosphatase [Planctomycetia bacterium]|nr:D-glycero-beta-D-manno-heptose 1,7-bisphosphate 7-phosphatase [Planctomycetia bacterium]